MSALCLLASPRKILTLVKRVVQAYLAYKFYRIWFPRKSRSVKGATVLVTGAGGGLGACICKEFARRSVTKIILWDINEDGVSKVAHELRESFPMLKEIKSQKVNLADRKDIYDAAKVALQNAGGRIDIVVNNAGLVTGQNFKETPDNKLELTMAVNCMAPMFITKAFLEEMLLTHSERCAAFLNIASFASFVGAAQMVDYSASKYALRGFCDGLVAELKQQGLWDRVKVSCICPAHISTLLFKGFHLPGAHTMTPEFVASKVVTAYESDQELVCLPRHYIPALFLTAISQAIGNLNLPNPFPRHSPLANFDRKQSDDIIQKSLSGNA
mmetsp:Transcript_104382/g.164722  ORF Transcript_104382/g.164722 Transcript_104382/m.164722 type:complete len:328 (-) Transcript_104382:375-1358(-)